MEPTPNVRCPVCGMPNECAPARSGSFDTPCWCTSVTVSPDALAAVPDAQRGVSCLCRRCASRTAAEDN